MNLVSIYSLGCTLLDELEVIHNAGYIHNDISLDKLSLGSKQRIIDNEEDLTTNCFKSVTVNIIDLTFVSEYKDRRTGAHLKQDKVESSLNLSNDFQSFNRLKSLRTSRKDDLVMLCYMLIYLSNMYEMPDL